MENKALRELEARRATRSASSADGMQFARGMFDLLALVDFASLASSVDELRQELPPRSWPASGADASREGPEVPRVSPSCPEGPQPTAADAPAEVVEAQEPRSPVPAEAGRSTSEPLATEPAATAAAASEPTPAPAASVAPAPMPAVAEPQASSPLVLVEEGDAAWCPGELPRVAFFAYMGLLLLVLGIPVLRLYLPASLLLMGVGVAGLSFAAKRFLDSRRRRCLAGMLLMLSRFAAGRESIPMAELSERSGIGQDELAGLCEDAIRQGSLPQGRVKTLPAAVQTLYLSDEAFERALAAAPAVPDGPQPPGPQQDAPATFPDASLDLGQREAIDAFKSFASDMEAWSGQAEDEAARAPVEGIARRAGLIADYVGAHPKLVPQLRHAVSYYLPQTGRLVSSYLELERSGAEGERARKVRADLLDALSMVDDGFARLQEDLIEDQSIDLTGDIQVMRTMLAQDGLTGEADELCP